MEMGNRLSMKHKILQTLLTVLCEGFKLESDIPIHCVPEHDHDWVSLRPNDQ